MAGKPGLGWPDRRVSRPFPVAAAILLAGFMLVSAGSVWAEPAPLPVSAFRPDPGEYRIGVFDRLNISVFGVKDLTLEQVPVDASGQIQMPLIGAVQAKDRTSREVSNEIATRLNEKYLNNAQVSVIVFNSANQKVTVEGAVTDAGVFDIPGHMTLLQAVALAKGPTNRADVKHVTVYRTVRGERTQLTFDVSAIRTGHAEDPAMFGNDLVVVPESKALSAFHELVSDIGAFSIFALFR